MGYVLNRKVRKMAKLNPTTMKTQYDGQYDTFCSKNHDYGNSFEESLDQFGIIASLVRMQDKMLRLQSLTDESKTQQVGSESLLDTLEDLSNYAAMTACWLKGVQAEDDVINKSYHAVKDLIETCDDSDVKYNELYHKRMLNSLYGEHIFRTPGENWQMIQCDNGFKPLGAEIETEIIPEPKLDESLSDYIKENVDGCVTCICQLMSRGELPTKGGIEHWTYNIGRCAIDHYEDPYTIIEHVKDMPSFRVLSDKNARLVIDSIKNYITDFNKEKEASKLTDHLKKFVEEVTDDIISVVLIKQRDEKMLVPADLDDDTSRIIKCITDNEFDPNYVVSYMEALMGNAGIPPYLREWIRGIILRGVYYRNKGRSMTKAKDKARGVVMKGSRGNSNVIVMASRGSGKGLMKARSLLEELGVPKEDIKEIFEGLEDEDEE